MNNEALKLEAEKREWIGETLIWARQGNAAAGLEGQVEEWIAWASERLNQPWTQPTA